MSTVSRRNFLRAGGISAAALMLASCTSLGREIARRDLPESLSTPVASAALAPLIRLLNRGGYGPRPGDLDRAAKLGLAAYLEEQLNPEAIADTAVDVAQQNLTYYPMDITQLLEQDDKDVAVD